MNFVRWLRSVSIGFLSFLNLVVVGLSWVLEFVVFERGDQYRYPPGILLIGVGLVCLLPYYVVKREDSGHGIAYMFAYAFLIIFAALDIQGLLQWLASRGH